MKSLIAVDDAVAVRFWSKVDKNGPVVRPELGPCWIWIGFLHPENGYGKLKVGGKRGRAEGAHRISWALHFDALGVEERVLHRCDNPACVRPDHLFKGTPADNARDRDIKGRMASRLTADSVRALRASAASGEPRAAIAARFGVSLMTVSDVVTRKTWQWVA